MSRMNEIVGHTIKRGCRTSFAWDIFNRSVATPLSLPVNVVAGEKDGPVLLLVFCQHGDETLPLIGWQQLYWQLHPEEIRGTVIALPLTNPVAAEQRSRNSWMDALHGDHGNLNRAWPGSPDGWLVERIAQKITEELLTSVDCVIDFHDGAAGGLHIYYSYLPNVEGAFGDKLRELALGFGMDILIDKSISYRGTLQQYLTTQEVLNVGVEIGRFCGFDGESCREPAEVTVTGITNVMKVLGMLDGKLQLPQRQAVVSPETRVKPEHAGFLIADVTPDEIGRTFSHTQSLLRIIDLGTMNEIEEVVGPYKQNLLLTAPTSGVLVNPGDHGCHVADADTLRWIEN